MQAAREESNIFIFGETQLKRESTAEQSISWESAEGTSPPNEQPQWVWLNPVWATTKISEHIAVEPRSTERYEATTEGWKTEQVQIRVTMRGICQGICEEREKSCVRNHDSGTNRTLRKHRMRKFARKAEKGRGRKPLGIRFRTYSDKNAHRNRFNV